MPITGRLISFVFGFSGAVVLRIVPCLLGLGENCRNMEKFFRFLHGSHRKDRRMAVFFVVGCVGGFWCPIGLSDSGNQKSGDNPIIFRGGGHREKASCVLSHRSPAQIGRAHV